MLDSAIINQLKDVFAGLTEDLTLVYRPSQHPQQAELLEMLDQVAETSSRITTRQQGEPATAPEFHIERAGRPTGISFHGVPGGHEFSSLVLALLNSDGKGRLADPAIQQRVGRLKGPIRLRTVVSLSCENCPEVVQSLNQMALFHKDFQHQMVDGAMDSQWVESLGLQGVPCVVAGNHMLHSGRSQFLQLLEKLEQHFGVEAQPTEQQKQDLGDFDTVVLGGGPAGVSAAIYSARKGLKTALIAERLGGQVKDTKGIENMISVVYTEGPELAEQLHQHLRAYPVTILEQRRVTGIDHHREITLDSGEKLRGDSVIIATGAKWRELGVPGEKEYIGRGVAYCPHCDGPFYAGKDVTVIGGGNSGVEAAIDLAGIAKSVTLLEYGENLIADQVLVKKLQELENTSVITQAKTIELTGDPQKLTNLSYEDRSSGDIKALNTDGVFVQIGLVPNSGFVKDIVACSPTGEIQVDDRGRTDQPGIYAAGDVTTTPYKQIIISMGEGAKVALAAFEDRMRR